MTKRHNACPEGWVNAGIKVPLHLTTRQEKYAARCVGVARAVYNQMVANDRDSRNAGVWLSPYELARELNWLKHCPEVGLGYITKVSKFVAQGAYQDFTRAYERWRNPDISANRPQFKKKNRNGTGSFLAASGVAKIKYDRHRRIELPYLGSLKFKRRLPEGVPYTIRIKKQNGQWYACINYWKPPDDVEDKTHVFGSVDVGITPLAVDSELIHYENPKPLRKHLRKLRRWQRAQSRRSFGSRGWLEAQQRVDAAYRHIVSLREDAHHQLSRHLVRKYAVLSVESLNVAGMDKLRHQARSIRDAAISELLQKIRYKADWYGTCIVGADRWYPSSKLCSDCGHHNNALRREPCWTCPQCGIRHDRNENAALNLLSLAIKAVDDLPDHIILGPVGPDVTLLDGKALATSTCVVSETGPNEGRTAPLTQEIEVDGEPAMVERGSTHGQLRLSV